MVSYYDGGLRADVLIDWIGQLERYFEYENVQDPNQVIFSTTKLKRHATKRQSEQSARKDQDLEEYGHQDQREIYAC